MSNSSDTTAGPSVNAQAQRAVLVAIATIAVNLAIYGLARVAGVSLIVPQPGDGAPTRLPLGAVVAASVLGVAMAAVALGLLRRFSPDRALSTFVAAVAIFFLVSLSGPIGLDTSLANKVVLVLMHIVTAGIAVVGLALWRPLGSAR